MNPSPCNNKRSVPGGQLAATMELDQSVSTFHNNGEKSVDCLINLADKQSRCVNYLAVEAIIEYLKREEKQR